MLAFVRLASRFARMLFHRTLTMFGRRRAESCALDPTREGVIATPDAVTISMVLSNPAQVMPSAAAARCDESGAQDQAVQIGASVVVPLDITDFNLGDIASVGIALADVRAVDVGGEQSPIPVNASHDAVNEELAQAAEGEPLGRDNEQENKVAEAARQTLTEMDQLVPLADVRPTPAESASVEPAERTECGAAPVPAAAEITSPELACIAPMDVASAAALPFGALEELPPDAISVAQSSCAAEPDEAPKSDLACRDDWPEADGANEGDDTISPSDPREPATGDEERLANTVLEAAGETWEADAASGGSVDAPAAVSWVETVLTP